MPLFNVKCIKCDILYRKVFDSVKEIEYNPCPKCGSTLERAPNPPSAQIKEILDNGIMNKRVERFKDAEELYRERSRNSDPRSGK